MGCGWDGHRYMYTKQGVGKVRKLGHLWSCSTYRINGPGGLQVTSQMLLTWWRQGKFSDTTVVQELLHWKCAGALRAIDEVTGIKQKRYESECLMKQHHVREMLRQSHCRFKRYTEVQRFLALHLPIWWGRKGRVPFLCLHGPSKLGKTELALSLFGINASLLINCQGAMVPDLSSFDPEIHKCIIFDEASPEMVHGQKALFQAGHCGTQLGMTTSNMYAKRYWLYLLPMIVCTNTWVEEGDPMFAWLNDNSIYLGLTEKVFETEQPSLPNFT